MPETSIWGPVLGEGWGVGVAEVRVTEADRFAPLVAKTLCSAVAEFPTPGTGQQPTWTVVPLMSGIALV